MGSVDYDYDDSVRLPSQFKVKLNCSVTANVTERSQVKSANVHFIYKDWNFSNLFHLDFNTCLRQYLAKWACGAQVGSDQLD